MKASDALFGPVEAGDHPLYVAKAEYNEPRTRDDGTPGNPSVNVRFEVTDGEMSGRILFQRFTINQNGRGKQTAFLMGAYKRITSKDAPEGMSDDELAHELAAGITGGKITGKVTVRPQKRYGVVVEGEFDNVITRWLD